MREMHCALFFLQFCHLLFVLFRLCFISGQRQLSVLFFALSDLFWTEKQLHCLRYCLRQPLPVLRAVQLRLSVRLLPLIFIHLRGLRFSLRLLHQRIVFGVSDLSDWVLQTRYRMFYALSFWLLCQLDCLFGLRGSLQHLLLLLGVSVLHQRVLSLGF